jgi:toxin FitB
MYVLDTDVVSELRKAGRADRHVVASSNVMPAFNLFLSAVTILELELGVLQVERRDPTQGGALRGSLNNRVLPAFADRVLSIDTAVARRCAQLHVPDPMADRDALIAATALVHGMTVVTRNTADFVRSGVQLINPWEC